MIVGVVGLYDREGGEWDRQEGQGKVSWGEVGARCEV